MWFVLRAKHPYEETEAKDNQYKLRSVYGKTYDLVAKHPLEDDDLKQFWYVHNNPNRAAVSYRAFQARKR